MNLTVSTTVRRSFYDKDAPIYTMSRFLPPSKVHAIDCGIYQHYTNAQSDVAPAVAVSGCSIVILVLGLRLSHRWAGAGCGGDEQHPGRRLRGAGGHHHQALGHRPALAHRRELPHRGRADHGVRTVCPARLTHRCAASVDAADALEVAGVSKRLATAALDRRTCYVWLSRQAASF